jgi:hypothetical protein
VSLIKFDMLATHGALFDLITTDTFALSYIGSAKGQMYLNNSRTLHPISTVSNSERVSWPRHVRLTVWSLDNICVARPLPVGTSTVRYRWQSQTGRKHRSHTDRFDASAKYSMSKTPNHCGRSSQQATGSGCTVPPHTENLINKLQLLQY